MSAFQIARTAYLGAMGALLLVDYFLLNIPLWMYLALSLLLLLAIVAGSSIMSLQFFAPTFTRLPATEKMIALTFDDGPSADHTPAVLQVLEKYGAKATFFCIGKRLEAHKELAAAMVAKGHVLGNHSYSHSNFFSTFGAQQVQEEIKRTNQVLQEITGTPCTIFRPPYGVTNPPIARAAAACNMQLIGWNLRSFDTATTDPQKVVQRVMKQLKPGTVLLLHDDRPHTAEILETLLAHAQQQNYRFVLVDKLIR